jgi:hypothetical protein
MAPRVELQALLETLTEHVYFQPPNNIVMQYPCIVYQRDAAVSQAADNETYRFTQRYMVTVIDRNPDSDLRLKVAYLPTARFSRFFVADNLNHDVFTLFF